MVWYAYTQWNEDCDHANKQISWHSDHLFVCVYDERT